jgi:hypothetical protein
MFSKTVRGLLDTDTRTYYGKLLPPGDLVRELPKSERSPTDMVVYRKGSAQYGYRNETIASLQALVKQLEAAKQVDDSGAGLDKRLDAWTQALTDPGAR